MTAPKFSDKAFALQMLEIAKGYIGTTRESDPAQILKFEELNGFNSISVAFCDSFLCWCGCKAYANLSGIPYSSTSAVEVFKPLKALITEYFFKTSPSCAETWAAAPLSHRITNFSQILPGDLVFFSWKGGGAKAKPDHIGIAAIAPDGNGRLFTVEGNTSNPAGQGSERDGGCVEQKSRNVHEGYFVGAIRIYQ